MIVRDQEDLRQTNIPTLEYNAISFAARTRANVEMTTQLRELWGPDKALKFCKHMQTQFRNSYTSEHELIRKMLDWERNQ